MVVKRILIVIISVLVIAAVIVVIVNSGTLYNGPPSDHFDGKQFFSKEPSHTFMDELKWFWNMKPIEWPEWIEDPKQPPPVKRVRNDNLRVTYINHATVLIQTENLNILADPIWSYRAGPVSWIGAKRVRAPGISMQDLPPIDIILISHDHYDHLDIPTLRQLNCYHKPVILAGLGMKKFLGSKGFSNVIEMDWWQKYKYHHSTLSITFVPARHDSGRNPLATNRTLWGGFVIETSSGTIYFAGDTAYGEFVNQIKKHFTNFRLALLPLGSYEKRWIMKSQHMNPDDAVKLHTLLQVKQSVGMHFGSFLEHPEQAINAHEKDLMIALKKYNVPESEFWILPFGEGRYVQ